VLPVAQRGKPSTEDVASARLELSRASRLVYKRRFDLHGCNIAAAKVVRQLN
jgi:hypothetical protein